MKTILATARAALDELEDLCIKQQDEIAGLKAKLAHKNDRVNPSIVGHDVIAKALLADHGSTPEQCLERAYQVWSKVIEDDSLSLNSTRFHDLLFMEPRSHLWTDDIFFGEPSYVVKPGGFNIHACAKCGWTGKNADDHKACPPKPKEVNLFLNEGTGVDEKAERIQFERIVSVDKWIEPNFECYPWGDYKNNEVRWSYIGWCAHANFFQKEDINKQENRGFKYEDVLKSAADSAKGFTVLAVHDSEGFNDGTTKVSTRIVPTDGVITKAHMHFVIRHLTSAASEVETLLNNYAPSATVRNYAHNALENIKIALEAIKEHN